MILTRADELHLTNDLFAAQGAKLHVCYVTDLLLRCRDSGIQKTIGKAEELHDCIFCMWFVAAESGSGGFS